MAADEFDQQRFTVEDVGRSNASSTSQQRSAPPPPSSSGGCFRGCLIGCGVIFILTLIAAGVGAYLLKQAVSWDPVEAGRRLQLDVPCQLPEGYDVGFSFSMGPEVKFFCVVPKGTTFVNLQEKLKTATLFLIVSAPKLESDQLHVVIKQHNDQDGPKKEEKQEDVEMKFGDKTLFVRKTVSKDERGDETISWNVVPRKGVLVSGFTESKELNQGLFEGLVTSILKSPPKVDPKVPTKEK